MAGIQLYFVLVQYLLSPMVSSQTTESQTTEHIAILNSTEPTTIYTMNIGKEWQISHHATGSMNEKLTIENHIVIETLPYWTIN